MTWHKATTLQELRAREAMVFKHGRHQLALFHVPGQGCHAIDNRCPHEGYPLSQGSVDERCVLTCNWHNWKFELGTGKNLLAGDDVRVYPVEVCASAAGGEAGEEVWVELTEPPVEQVIAAALSGLRRAFDDQDHGWIARELARLLAAGADPAQIAVPAALKWCASRLEYGLRHSFAATADWLSFHDRLPADAVEARLVCLSEAIEHLAHDALREPERPYPEASADPFDHARWLDAVEAEDEAAAIGLIRRGVADGLDFAALEPSLTRAALRHYTGFGHGLIYVTKIGELLGRYGPELRDPALSALTRYLVYATREDLIPEFRPLAAALADYPGGDPGTDLADEAIDDVQIDALFGLGLRPAFAWIHEHARRHTPARLWDALVRVNARSMLCFDTDREAASQVKVADSIGWLDFTHALTFARAVRQQCERFPELWPAGLLQLACFCARNRAYLLREPSPDALLARWRVVDEAAFWAAVDEQLLDHGLGLPIYSAHLVKTSTAVARELPVVSAATRELLLAALRRYLAAPVKQKHGRRNVHQAMTLIGLA